MGNEEVHNRKTGRGTDGGVGDSRAPLVIQQETLEQNTGL